MKIISFAVLLLLSFCVAQTLADSPKPADSPNPSDSSKPLSPDDAQHPFHLQIINSNMPAEFSFLYINSRGELVFHNNPSPLLYSNGYTSNGNTSNTNNTNNDGNTSNTNNNNGHTSNGKLLETTYIPSTNKSLLVNSFRYISIDDTHRVGVSKIGYGRWKISSSPNQKQDAPQPGTESGGNGGLEGSGKGGLEESGNDGGLEGNGNKRDGKPFNRLFYWNDSSPNNNFLIVAKSPSNPKNSDPGQPDFYKREYQLFTTKADKSAFLVVGQCDLRVVFSDEMASGMASSGRRLWMMGLWTAAIAVVLW